MKTIHYLYLFISLLSCYTACSQPATQLVNQQGQTIGTRINPPEGFIRQNVDEKSFAYYLRNLPLKEHGSPVLYHNGKTKPQRNVYMAVVNMEIGKRDLQQCADAVIRLRAEYLYGQKRYDEIAFNFTSGFKASYSEWMKGKRISVNGNKVNWTQSSAGFSNSYDSFRKYLDIVFIYAGTLSLSKELKQKNIERLESGDVFIQGGSPGHAVIVVDVAVNPKTGEKVFLLAQSYMPAQDIQILQNPNNSSISPWYSIPAGTLYTPEWTFKNTDLKTF